MSAIFGMKNKSKYKSNSKNQEFDESMIFNNKSNLIKLTEEFNSNQRKIIELKSKLKDYDFKLNEITLLNMKVNYLNKLIKSKNKIINDYEHLSELFKEKYMDYFNKDKEGESTNDIKLKLQEENEALMEYLSDLKDQNNYYKKQINFQSNNNSSKLNDIRIELQSIKNRKDKSLNRSQILRSKNNNRDEIFEIQSKINECNNDNKEFDEIKDKYEILEKKFIIKNNIIKRLENDNQSLYKIFNSLNKNYEKIYLKELSNQQLKMKIKNYEDLYEKYENDRLKNMNGKF
jgi:hypothetical protein